MVEDSRVPRKREIFNLADKITRYFSNWLFLKICFVYNVIPNGLKLKKRAQIGKKSQHFQLQWDNFNGTISCLMKRKIL